ncbi:hypothetical protein DNTS_005540 [Danionella cerebrum]|uniref:RING-type E3 ubiquitin transferase n=1 Tax=Danionella cerebrum TaxID=2873325 RepID=A0A553NJU1_9TELE|nr:hypothetical protein DNTS_005540 [Danionella translucida]
MSKCKMVFNGFKVVMNWFKAKQSLSVSVMSQTELDLFSEQELTCSICLDLFTEPVSTPCGHNFCRACIGGFWASAYVSGSTSGSGTSSGCCCPLCKRLFPERPELNINRGLNAIAQKYKEKYYSEGLEKNQKQTPEPGAERVLCDLCSGVRTPAERSCLTCVASFCHVHLLPHQQNQFYQNHRLLDPAELRHARTCREHQGPLEFWCRTDQCCICAVCVLEQHRTHTTVSLTTERSYRQRLLGKTELELQSRIDRKSAQLSELKNTLSSLKRYAHSELAELQQLLSDITVSLQQIGSDLVGGVTEQRDSVIGRGERTASRLEEELKVLRENRAQLEEQAQTHDHVHFLQSFDAAIASVQNTRTEDTRPDELTLRFSLDEVKVALGDVRQRLDEIRAGELQHTHSASALKASESMMSVSSLRRKEWSLKDLRKLKPGHKKVKAYFEELTLDPATAYPFLILSEDRKQLKRGEKLQIYRNNPQRFDVWSCVLAREGFHSGRHYWEVSVFGSSDWKLGVMRSSSSRKGLLEMSPAQGFFCVWWSAGHLRALSGPTPARIRLSGGGGLRLVGVFLDLEGGQVSFYNGRSGALLHTFSFTQESESEETMIPLFGTADTEHPLGIISPPAP